MNSLDIEERVISTIAEQLGIDKNEVVREALLGDDLGADDQDVSELIGELEGAFEVSIDDEDLSLSSSVEDVIGCVTEKVGE